MRTVTVATTQMTCSWDKQQNIDTATDLVTQAAKAGANIILLQELFETPYFCQVHDFDYFKLATSVADNTAIQHFKKLAKELEVVLPISFYEKSGNTFFNSVTVIDADGEILGTYRKTHIPDGIPYAEKFYFTQEILALRFGRPNTPRLVSVSAGISGSLNVRAVWR